MSDTINPTELWLTLGVFAASIAVIVWMVWLERRPTDILKPRLFPTTPVLLLSAFVALLAMVHLVNLYGIHTGRGP